MNRHSFPAALIIILLSSCGGGLRIESVTPQEAKSGIPAMIDIKGNGFQPGATVKIAGVASAQVVVVGPKQLVALLPRDLPAGPATLEVTNPDGTRVEKAGALSVLSGLNLAGVDPASVNQGEPAQVQLSGTGFVSGMQALFNDLPATVEVKSDRLAVATLPAELPAGLVTIRLESPDGGQAELLSGFQVLGDNQAIKVKPLRDETIALGVDATTMTSRSGVAVADFNADGRFDLAITDPYEVRILLNGPGSFKDVTADSGIKAPGITYGAFPADFDNDGLADLMVTGQPGKLFHNLGDGRFEEVTARVGLPADFICWSAAWGDFDADGLLDLYIGAPGTEDMLMRNLGGRFEQVFEGRWQKMETATKINNRQPSTFSVAFGDVNNDGYPELMAGVRGQDSRFYLNRKGKDLVFSNEPFGFKFGLNNAYKINWGLSFVDFDNDGWLDLFSASGPTGADLYRNIGGQSFANVTAGMGIRFANSPICPAWGDFDNDGWSDLALADNENGVFVYRNRGDGSFEEVQQELAVPDPNLLMTPMAVVWFDYNRDGALDLYCAGFAQPNRLLVNSPYPDHHYLQVRLEGTRSNRDGIGAVVSLEVGDWKFTQQVAAGSGYLMSPPPVLHFGLGPATVIDKLTVRWPGGTTQSLEQVPADQLLKITEPGERKKVTLPPAPTTPAAAPAAPAPPPK